MQRKIHNKTLFVAALSVYLGLLIVGAPPQVLAQQVQKAIKVTQIEDGEVYQSTSKEIADELDKSRYPTIIRDFLSDLKGLARMGRYDADESEFNFEFVFAITEDGIQQVTYFDPKNRKYNSSGKWIFLACEESANGLESFEMYHNFDRFFYRYDTEFNRNARHGSALFESNKDGLTIKTTLEKQSPKKSRDLATLYNSTFSFGAIEYKEDLPNTSLIYQNTKALSENNNLIIVTRLPRAGLDSLLKADEKAN